MVGFDKVRGCDRGWFSSIVVTSQRHLSNGVNWHTSGCCAGSGHRNRRWVVEKSSQSKMIENSLTVFGLGLWNRGRFNDWITGIFNLLHSQKVENDFDELWIEIEKDVTVCISFQNNGVVTGSKVVFITSIEQFAKRGILGRKAESALEDLKDFATGVDGDDLVLYVAVRHAQWTRDKMHEYLLCLSVLLRKTNYVHNRCKSQSSALWLVQRDGRICKQNSEFVTAFPREVTIPNTSKSEVKKTVLCSSKTYYINRATIQMSKVREFTNFIPQLSEEGESASIF